MHFSYPFQIDVHFRNTERNIRTQMQEQLQKEMGILLQSETEKMKRKFSDHRADDPLSIMKSLSGKDPVQILDIVFNSFLTYIHPKDVEHLRQFFQWVLSERHIRHLFLLSIYKGAYSADKLLPDFLDGRTSWTAASPSYQHQHTKPRGKLLEVEHFIGGAI